MFKSPLPSCALLLVLGQNANDKPVPMFHKHFYCPTSLSISRGLYPQNFQKERSNISSNFIKDIKHIIKNILEKNIKNACDPKK